MESEQQRHNQHRRLAGTADTVHPRVSSPEKGEGRAVYLEKVALSLPENVLENVPVPTRQPCTRPRRRAEQPGGDPVGVGTQARVQVPPQQLSISRALPNALQWRDSSRTGVWSRGRKSPVFFYTACAVGLRLCLNLEAYRVRPVCVLRVTPV